MSKLYVTLLTEKYGTRLKNIEAVKELGLSSGRELGALLYTPVLPSLLAEDVAEYKATLKKLSLKERLEQKYGQHDEPLSMEAFAYELAITAREGRALINAQILHDTSITQIVYFLEESEMFLLKSTKRKYLKRLYWDEQLSVEEIANILAIDANEVTELLVKRNLIVEPKRVKPRVKKTVAVKPRKNRHRKKTVTGLDPFTFQVVCTFGSIVEASRAGFNPTNVSRSCRSSLKVFLDRWGNPKGITALVSGVKFFYTDEVEQKRKELLDVLKKSIKENNMSKEDVKKIFKFSNEIMKRVM